MQMTQESLAGSREKEMENGTSNSSWLPLYEVEWTRVEDNKPRREHADNKTAITIFGSEYVTSVKQLSGEFTHSKYRDEIDHNFERVVCIATTRTRKKTLRLHTQRAHQKNKNECP